MIGPAGAQPKAAGTASTCCTPRHRAWARSTWGFCRARRPRRGRHSRRRFEGRNRFRLSARRRRIRYARSASAFVVYQGTMATPGAHRADVVLPGAAYTEKEGLYVNFEGPRAARRRAPSRRAKPRKIGRSCARCPTCWGKRLPYDDRDALRARHRRRCAAFCGSRELCRSCRRRRRDLGRHRNGRAKSTGTSRSHRRLTDFYLTNPIARASETMAECSRIFVTGGASKMAAE
jgi:NADH-quinone oxidoreductase subunit G